MGEDLSITAGQAEARVLMSEECTSGVVRSKCVVEDVLNLHVDEWLLDSRLRMKKRDIRPGEDDEHATTMTRMAKKDDRSQATDKGRRPF